MLILVMIFAAVRILKFLFNQNKIWTVRKSRSKSIIDELLKYSQWFVVVLRQKVFKRMGLSGGLGVVPR